MLPAKYNAQNEREDTWFSILPGNDLDAFVGNDWSVLLGNNVSNGCEDLEGSLMTRADFGGDCNIWVPLVPVCDDGAEAATGMSWLMVYLDAGEEFKFAPQAGWGNDFGMSAEV